jgi:hypothetical protein
MFQVTIIDGKKNGAKKMVPGELFLFRKITYLTPMMP